MKRQIRRLIFSHGFQDHKRAETVNKLSTDEILAALTGPVQLCQIPQVEKGEVLVDSRGQGSFQR
jgi:hypothetical protein